MNFATNRYFSFPLQHHLKDWPVLNRKLWRNYNLWCTNAITYISDYLLTWGTFLFFVHVDDDIKIDFLSMCFSSSYVRFGSSETNKTLIPRLSPFPQNKKLVCWNPGSVRNQPSTLVDVVNAVLVFHELYMSTFSSGDYNQRTMN